MRNKIKPIYYFILIEFIVFVYLIKLIFGSYEVFLKSLVDHFFPDKLLPNPLEKLAVLLLAGLTILLDIFMV